METFQPASEPVELEPVQIHVLRSDRGIQSVKNAAYAIHLLSVDAFALAPGEEAFDAFVAKALDHLERVM